MYRAVSPAVPKSQREALLSWLEVIAGSGLLAPGGRLRLLRMFPDQAHQPAERRGLIQVGTRRVLVVGWEKRDNETTAVDYAPDGAFGPVPGYRLATEVVYGPFRVTPEEVMSFVALARERGPLPWRPELPAALSAASGLSLAEATAVLAGHPDDEERKEWRAGGLPASGLAVSEAALDRAAQTWSNHQLLVGRAGALVSLLPDDLAALWADGPAVGRLTAWLTERRGARVAVDDESIIAAHKANVARGMGASELLHGIVNAGTCRWLHGRVSGLDDDDVVESVVRVIPWSAVALPAGHPVRRALPAVLELARARLADPEAFFGVGRIYNEDAAEKLAGLGVPVTTDEHGTSAGPVHVDPGRYANVQIRPALLAGPDDPVLQAVAERLYLNLHPVTMLRVLLSDALTTWAAYEPPAEVVGAEHDPSRAVPALVAEVAAAHGLSADAAALYLQLLALPDPNDRNVAAWTGWKPARLKAARAELAGTDLVVEGKRARAGRSLFLPGGWIARKAPLPPAETWKQPLVLDGIGDAVTPVVPAPLLFGVAWQRVRDGDGPRFDELDLGRRR
jgi:hypothetical protein